MLNYEHLYRVTFLTKKGGVVYWVIDIGAYTPAAAKNIAETMWYRRVDAHMFNVEVRRINGGGTEFLNKFVAIAKEEEQPK